MAASTWLLVAGEKFRADKALYEPFVYLAERGRILSSAIPASLRTPDRTIPGTAVRIPPNSYLQNNSGTG